MPGGGDFLLYRVSVAVEIDDPQEVKEALTLKLEELGFPTYAALVTVEPVQLQLDFLAVESLRRARKVEEQEKNEQ